VNPPFFWVSRWRLATPYNLTQPLRTEKLAKHSEGSSAVEGLYKTASRIPRDLAARFV